MVSCIYIALWVKDELAFDYFHDNYNDLYRLNLKIDNTWHKSTPWALTPSLKGKYPEIKQMSRFSTRQYSLKMRGRNSNETGALIDKAFFEMFSFPLSKGNLPEIYQTEIYQTGNKSP